MANGLIIIENEKEFLFIAKEIDMKGIGKMEKGMGKG